MVKKILLVEDMEEKANAIISYLKGEFPYIEVVRKESYNSSQKEIYAHYNDYFVVLLDMSMHTFDRSKEESGGEPEPVAGRKILNGMYLRDISTKVIVVTMYGSHEGKKLLTFVDDLKEEYPDNYYDYVFFSFQKNDWKEKLKQQINHLL